MKEGKEQDTNMQNSIERSLPKFTSKSKTSKNSHDQKDLINQQDFSIHNFLSQSEGNDRFLSTTYFLQGLQPDQYFNGTSQCFYSFNTLIYNQTAQYQEYLSSTSETLFNKTLITTVYLQQVASSLSSCNDMLLNLYLYMNYQVVSLGSPAGFMQSLISNILGNVISLTYIYQSFTKNQINNNKEGMAYDTGRIIRLIFFGLKPVDIEYSPQTNKVQQKLIEQNFQQLYQTQSKYQNYKDFSSLYSIDHKRLSESSSSTDQQNLNISAVENIFQFITGFSNGSAITTTPNITQCQGTINEAVYQYELSYQKAADNQTLYGILSSTKQLLQVPNLFYAITFSCYFGVFESYSLMILYLLNINSAYFMISNFIINFGILYENFKDILIYFTDLPYEGDSSISDIGKSLGAILYYLIVPSSKLIDDSSPSTFN